MNGSVLLGYEPHSDSGENGALERDRTYWRVERIQGQDLAGLTTPRDQNTVQYKKLHPCSAKRVTTCSIFLLSSFVIGLTFSPRFSRSFRLARLSHPRANVDMTYRIVTSRRSVNANAQKTTK